MATERAEFELHLDDRPFQQSMNRARGATVGLTESVNKAGASIGAAATSVSGLNTALGGSVGKTNDLIGAAGNLASTFAAAGPVGLAIAAATTGIGYLINAWQDAQEEARKTAEETKKAAEQMARDLANVQLELKARAGGISTDLAKAAEQQNQLAKQAAEKLAFLGLYGFGGNLATLPSQQSGDLISRSGSRISGDSPLAAKIRKASAEFVELTKQAKIAEDYIVGKLELEDAMSPGSPIVPTGGGRGGGRGGRRGGRGGGGAASDFVGPEMPFYVAQARGAVAPDDGTGLLMELAFQEFDEREKLAVRLADVEIEQQKRVTDSYELETMERVAMAQQFAGTFFSLSEQIASVMVEGQRDAAVQILNIVAQTAGGFLIGKGIELVGQGVQSLLTPGGQPLGAAQIAGGLALGSAGVALKVGGAVALDNAASMVGGAAGGAGVPASTSAGAGRDVGSGGGGNGGGLTIIVNNGIGMSREDTQRAVVEAHREGLRRGFR